MSRAQLLAGLAVATGSILAFTHSREPLRASTSAPEPPPIDYSDPLSSLEPEVLIQHTGYLRDVRVSELLRQYVVFLGSSQSYLVSSGPWMLDKLEWFRDHVPLVGAAVWSIFALGMKGTFYSVFVGGGSVPECKHLVDELAEHGIGCLLNYSAEASGEASHAMGVNEANITESCNALRQAANFDEFDSTTLARKGDAKWSLKPTLFAIKLTGLVYDPQVLARATTAIVESSSFQRGGDLPANVLFPDSPHLSEDDHAVLATLYDGLRRIATEAQVGGVRLLVDAEQSWYQISINRFVDLLSAEFNKVTPHNSVDSPAIPIIYNTYQAYLRTTPPTMKAAIARAERGSYSFGAKLVRGAYVDAERQHHAATGTPDNCVVWGSKHETDSCYDECALLLEGRVAREIREGKPGQPGTGVVFASHNGPSTLKVLLALRNDGLAQNVDGGVAVDERVRGRISFAQLFGMSDNLTSTLVSLLKPSKTGTMPASSIPFVNKYVPYATVNQALPYLIRRAGENQSILHPDPSSGRGGAMGERRAIGKELRSRVGLRF